MTLPNPDIPDNDAIKEYWKQLGVASVELAKTQLATGFADDRQGLTRQRAQDKADDEEFVTRRGAEWTNELEIHKTVLNAMIETAKGSIERSRDSAKFVQTVSAALAGGYTTILALVFAAKDNPLPARGFIPTIFFGLAAGLATAYLAFLMEGESVTVPVGSSFPRENSLRKVVLFIRWTGSSVFQRAPLLRAGVVALLLGIAFLPIAVIDLTSPPSIPLIAEHSTAAPTPTPVPTASPEPSPSPEWPTAPASPASAEMTLELYKAQLAAHVGALASATPPPAATAAVDDTAAETFSWRLALVGLVVVGIVAIVPFGWRWARKRFA